MLSLSASPHIRSSDSVPSMMRSVIIALLPICAAAILFFHIKALLLLFCCVATSVLSEWAIVKYLYKRKKSTISDFSALVTGLLLALSLPPGLPIWMACIGALFSIGVVKMAFGGLGNTIVNPALAGRIFLQLSYPIAMNSWSATIFGSFNGLASQNDAIASATPLAAFSMTVSSHTFDWIVFQKSLLHLCIGNVSGCIGETSVIIILAGAGYLLFKRIIRLIIPLSCIISVFVLSLFFNGITHNILTPDAFIAALVQVASGGLLLAAFFMATDPVTSPISFSGHLLFGCGCGVLTFFIRKFGAYPEGIAYAILIMNLFVPLINRYMQPKIYGKVQSHE